MIKKKTVNDSFKRIYTFLDAQPFGQMEFKHIAIFNDFIIIWYKDESGDKSLKITNAEMMCDPRNQTIYCKTCKYRNNCKFR